VGCDPDADVGLEPNVLALLSMFFRAVVVEAVGPEAGAANRKFPFHARKGDGRKAQQAAKKMGRVRGLETCLRC
jgi:hypothetical protein